MTLFAFGRIFDDSLQSDKSGDWEGAGMSLLGILLGVLSIKISKKLNSTGEQPNRTAQANHSTRGANEN